MHTRSDHHVGIYHAKCRQESAFDGLEVPNRRPSLNRLSAVLRSALWRHRNGRCPIVVLKTKKSSCLTDRMFTSFAQLASSLEASLSLDNLQNTPAGAKKSDGELSNSVPDISNGKTGPKPFQNHEGSKEQEDTEFRLVEEISRVSELLRAKGLENDALNSQLNEVKNEAQARKLAFCDLQDEYKLLKSLEKSAADESDDRASSAQREIVDLREELNRQVKSSEDKSSKILSLQSELSAASSLNVTNAAEHSSGDNNDHALLQLQHENASLKREISQFSNSLNESTEHVRSLDVLMEEAKTLRRTQEDQLTSSSREIKSLKDDLQSVKNDLHNYQLESARLQEESLKEYLNEKISLQEIIGTLEAEVLQQKAINNALREMREKQSTADAEKTLEMEDLYRSLSQASDTAEQEKCLLITTQSEIKNLNIIINDKNDIITDLQSKLTTLTDKMKDLVKKYGELKTKNSNLEQTGGEKSAEISKNLQGKVRVVQYFHF